MLRLVLLCLGVLSALPAAAAERITVFAAASLQESLDEVGRLWTERSGQPVMLSYGASSALARQIEQGAPAHVFVSADLEWMDYLAERKLVDAATRANLVRNRLVVVGQASEKTTSLALVPGALPKALGSRGRLAVAETESVPAGRYAREALVALGLWAEVEQRLAQGDNVRASLAFVARGEAPLGIVYATDARAEPKVRVLAKIPASSHAPIVYPVARVAGTDPEAVAGFLYFLAGPEARAVFERAGFDPP